MSSYNILLVGVGQIGSRHLQGLAHSNIPLLVDIVDISQENKNVALQRFSEVSSNKVVIGTLYQDIDAIVDKAYDLAIISTNADIRAIITENLVTKVKVSNIIFEKVAFQSTSQFSHMMELLEEKGIKSWVNCARRYFSGYIQLAQELKHNGPIEFNLTGADWGLACNAVHYIDLFSYLSGNYEYSIISERIENQIYKTKREGFVEFYGDFQGLGNQGSTFTIECTHQDQNPIQNPISIDIMQNNLRYNISETLNRVRVVDIKTNSLLREFEVGAIYQSQLTGIQTEDIIRKGDSILPSIGESYYTHKPFLEMLKQKYIEITNEEISLLPIT